VNVSFDQVIQCFECNQAFKEEKKSTTGKKAPKLCQCNSLSSMDA
jgi:hypothetical protein